MVYKLQLSLLDQDKEALCARHPGWRIWFVPHATDGSVTWCAHRLPTINCASVAELDAAIAEAEAEHLAEAQAAGHPARDSESHS